MSLIFKLFCNIQIVELIIKTSIQCIYYSKILLKINLLYYFK